MSKTVLIIGGYGVFGGRLAKALSEDARFRVVVAGRSESAAQRFCDGVNCEPLRLDRHAAEFEHSIRALSPFIIIDAAGPFQSYHAQAYRLVEIAIACGAHYLDLSDDADFTSGVTTYDAAAKLAGLVVLSGVSSVPALSSAVVNTLSNSIDDIHLIESVILPGNRAPRGMSVIKAIVSQVGRPVRLWKAGRYVDVPGWGKLKRVTIENTVAAGGIRRWSSVIGAPDLRLFPDYFQARNVSFRAGLDLKLMHGGLWLLSWLVRLRLLKSLLPLSGLLKMAADSLERFGSDIGGMVVTVVGLDREGAILEKRWELVVKDGDGPNIPTVAAQILCAKLLSGNVAHGARPCLGAFSLMEAEDALRRLSVSTSVKESVVPIVFQTVLTDAFDRLPAPLRDLHTVIEARRWRGRASIKRGRGVLSRIAGGIAGFPKATEDIAVQVEMQKTAHGETWTRTFGKAQFSSHLSARGPSGCEKLYERFGPMRFEISLALEDGSLRFPVKSGRIRGVPLPRFMLPKSDAKEYVDQDGRVCFYVEVSLPITGHVATYSGWLEPVG